MVRWSQLHFRLSNEGPGEQLLSEARALLAEVSREFGTGPLSVDDALTIASLPWEISCNMGRFVEAASYLEVVRQSPDFSAGTPQDGAIEVCLGVTLLARGLEEQACTHYQRGIHVSPRVPYMPAKEARNQLASYAERRDPTAACSHEFSRLISELGRVLKPKRSFSDPVTYGDAVEELSKMW